MFKKELMAVLAGLKQVSFDEHKESGSQRSLSISFPNKHTSMIRLKDLKPSEPISQSEF